MWHAPAWFVARASWRLHFRLRWGVRPLGWLSLIPPFVSVKGTVRSSRFHVIKAYMLTLSYICWDLQKRLSLVRSQKRSLLSVGSSFWSSRNIRGYYWCKSRRKDIDSQVLIVACLVRLHHASFDWIWYKNTQWWVWTEWQNSIGWANFDWLREEKLGEIRFVASGEIRWYSS